jgi:hypothetical protein
MWLSSVYECIVAQNSSIYPIKVLTLNPGLLVHFLGYDYSKLCLVLFKIFFGVLHHEKVSEEKQLNYVFFLDLFSRFSRLKI